MARRRPSDEMQRLGFLSARYESGGRGVGFISSGAGDPGGASYGIHQLSGRGSMPAFLRSPEGRPYREEFRNFQPMTREFNRIYAGIAQRDPQGFAAAQQAFYQRTHYEPVRQVAERAGFNVQDRGVQEALFSMSIQHGKARDLVARAGQRIRPEDPAAVQVRALYQTRAAYVAGLNTLPERTRIAVLNRYQREGADALAIAGLPQVQAAAAETSRAPNLGVVDPSNPDAPERAPQLGVVDPFSGEPSQRAPISPVSPPQDAVADRSQRTPQQTTTSPLPGSPASGGYPAWATEAFSRADNQPVDPVGGPISPFGNMPPPPPLARDIFGAPTTAMALNRNQPMFRSLMQSLFGGGGFGQ